MSEPTTVAVDVAPTRRTVQVSNNIVRVQPTVAVVDVAITYTPPTRRTVQVSNNIVRTWRVQPTVAVDVAMT